MTTYASFPLPRVSVSRPVFTQTLSESVAAPRRITVTTGLFETHPHLLRDRSPSVEPAWKQEQRRVPRRKR